MGLRLLRALAAQHDAVGAGAAQAAGHCASCGPVEATAKFRHCCVLRPDGAAAPDREFAAGEQLPWDCSGVRRNPTRSAPRTCRGTAARPWRSPDGAGPVNSAGPAVLHAVLAQDGAQCSHRMAPTASARCHRCSLQSGQASVISVTSIRCVLHHDAGKPRAGPASERIGWPKATGRADLGLGAFARLRSGKATVRPCHGLDQVEWPHQRERPHSGV